MATCLAFYCIFFACGPGQNFFNSDECADNPRNITIFVAMFSGGYFFVDLILLVVYTHCQTVMQKQYLMHHLIGWLLLTLPLITHDYFTSASVAYMIVEVSGAFPSIRWLMFQHGFTNTNSLMTLNSMLLAFTFLFGRMPLLMVLIFKSTLWEWLSVFTGEPRGWLYILFVVFCGITFCLILLLNFYWAYAMVKMVTKVLKGGSMPAEGAETA